MPKKCDIPRPYVDQSIIERLGIKDVKYFYKSFDTLCDRWWDTKSARTDSVGGMLITSKLASHLNEPLIISIIADDVECFKKHYSKSKDIFALEFSCLCGSEKIIKEFYLQPDQSKYLLLSKNAIAYALSSGKPDLAFSLAKAAVKVNKKDPGQLLLYSFGDYRSAKTIKQMFNSNNPSDTVSIVFKDEEPNTKKPKL